MEEWHYSKDHMRQIYDEWKQTMPEWLISESHELEVVTHYDDWKNDEQARRMKEDIEGFLEKKMQKRSNQQRFEYGQKEKDKRGY